MEQKTETQSQEKPTCQPGHEWGNTVLVVEDGTKAIETYTKVFGFELKGEIKNKEDKFLMARLSYHNFELLLFDHESSGGAHAWETPKRSGVTSPVSFYIYREDIDELVKKAKASGLEVTQEPDLKYWGDTTCVIKDQDGYGWEFAKFTADFNPSKAPEYWQ